MAGIDRVNGSVTTPVTLHGGYPMLFLKVVDSNSGFTADSGGGTNAITEGGFTVAVRAIQTIATIVYLGARANGQFVVALDSSTAQPTGPAYDTDATPTIAERVKAVIEATDTFGATITVTDVSNLTTGQI